VGNISRKHKMDVMSNPGTKNACYDVILWSRGDCIIALLQTALFLGKSFEQDFPVRNKNFVFFIRLASKQEH
jgi:hypothetical protein